MGEQRRQCWANLLQAPILTTPSQQRATPDPSQDSEAMFCHHCDDSLAGHRYVLRDDHPYCIKCYENVFANNCDECGKIIGIDSKDLSYKEKHWHEVCFVCSKCRTSLVDKQFGSKADRIYCGPCYDAQFATRCDGSGTRSASCAAPARTPSAPRASSPRSTTSTAPS